MIRSPESTSFRDPAGTREDPATGRGTSVARVASFAVAGFAVEGGGPSSAAQKRSTFFDGNSAPCFDTDPETLAAVFPGRWNRRRDLPEGLGCLVQAYATALKNAGWWTMGQTELVDGGSVLGTDYHSLSVSTRYARELAEHGPAGISPSDFLFSLPSSASAVLGVLFGLRHYQATVTGGGNAGFQAIQHARDILSLGRVGRLVVGASTVVTPEWNETLPRLGYRASPTSRRETLELAVAFCLEPVGGESECGGLLVRDESWVRPEVRSPALERSPRRTVQTAETLDDIPANVRPLAAPSLLALSREARRLREGGDAAAVMRVMHVDPTDSPVPPLELVWSAARDPENT